MRDRLVTLAGALVALALVYALFLKRPAEPPVSRPQSVEAGPNGYLALRTWLEGEGVAVASLRERYAELAEGGRFAPRGNLLVVTLPFVNAVRGSELLPLLRWVRDGNTLLVLAALDDSPDWLASSRTTSFMRDLRSLTGLAFVTTGAADGADGAGAASAEDGREVGRERPRGPFAAEPIPAGAPVEIVPAVDHPLWQGVDSLRGFSDGASEIWVARNVSQSLVLVLGAESSTGAAALWEVPRGAGDVVIAASGSLLTNRNIGAGDARSLVRNLLRHRLGPNGAVIFDDMHQGLSTLYDPAAFARDPRLAATLWFVLGAWLVYLLGTSNRLAPPRKSKSVPRQRDFLIAAGGFMARRLDRREAGLVLLREWFDEVRRARGLAADERPPWAEIEATPALARRTYERLRRYHQRLAGGGAVDLVDLHNALHEAREAIG